MPSEFIRRPRLFRGALVFYLSQTPGAPPNVINFQYNPEKLSRSLALRTPPSTGENKAGEAKAEAFKIEGPPTETINLTIVLDAADQLENPVKMVDGTENSILPALSALELLMYPSENQLMENKIQAALGSASVNSENVPLVLLVWGRARIVPVRLTGFSISEEHFNQAMNPIQAKVQLAMTVLTYMELEKDSIGYMTYTAHYLEKERIAKLNVAAQSADVLNIMK